MVKKLLKYEWLSYFRTMFPFYGILLGIAALCRFIQFFESEDSIAYNIVFISSIVALCIAIVVGLVMTVIVAISRFYKSLYTAEGYLSFTLPVTPAQLLFTKLGMAMIFMLLTLVISLLAGTVATLGSVFVEVMKALGYLADLYFTKLGVHGAFYLLEGVIALLVATATGTLLLFGCITVGQLAHKNRILAAFGAYFAYYLFTQIVGTIFVIIFSINADAIEDFLEEFADKYPHGCVHTGLCAGIVFALLLSALYAFITHRIMTRRLNLE